MAEETPVAFKNERISNFRGLVTLTFDLGSGHTAYRHASLIDGPKCQLSLKSKKLLFVDGRTQHGRTNI